MGHMVASEYARLSSPIFKFIGMIWRANLSVTLNSHFERKNTKAKSSLFESP
jgi:hypothetical protein